MSWTKIAKDVFIAVAKQVEQQTAAEADLVCGNSVCQHKRSEHCGCGQRCNGYRDGGTADCSCKGFEHPPAASST